VLVATGGGAVATGGGAVATGDVLSVASGDVLSVATRGAAVIGAGSSRVGVLFWFSFFALGGVKATAGRLLGVGLNRLDQEGNTMVNDFEC
jgi:hypothetical protein